MKLRHTEVGLPAGGVWLDGLLAHSPLVGGLVLLAERSGSQLKTARGALFASALQQAGLATLQFGLLSHDEERRSPDTWYQHSTLGPRLSAVLEWVEHQPALKDLPLGLACRDAAAAAMIRIAPRSPTLRALACRHGWPDLAGTEPLRALELPLLQVVGERDSEGVQRNRQAHELLSCPRELLVVPGASRNFEEPGTLDQASRAMATWFRRWLTAAGSSTT
jgi:hypothetical protein